MYILYHPGNCNALDDDTLSHWDLFDSALISYFNLTYLQIHSRKLYHLELSSKLIIINAMRISQSRTASARRAANCFCADAMVANAAVIAGDDTTAALVVLPAAETMGTSSTAPEGPSGTIAAAGDAVLMMYGGEMALDLLIFNLEGMVP